MDYALREPNKTEGKQAFRYPFISHEILKSGSFIVINYFFKNRQSSPEQELSEMMEKTNNDENEEEFNPKTMIYTKRMDRLFKVFLNSEDRKNPVLSGYFNAIVTSLVNRKQKEMTDYFFDPLNEDIAQLLLKSLEVSSLSDLLKTFLVVKSEDFFDYATPDAVLEKCKEELQYKQRQFEIVNRMHEVYEKTDDLETKVNIKSVISHITKNYHSFGKRESFLYNIIFGKKSFTAHLIRDMIRPVERGDLSEKLSRKASAEILIEILGILSPSKKPSNETNVMGNLDILRNKLASAVSSSLASKALNKEVDGDEVTEPIIDELIEGVGLIGRYLQNLKLSKMTNSLGVEINVLENYQIAIFEVLLTLSFIMNPLIDKALHDAGIVKLMMKYVLVCKWNSLYHVIFGKLIKHIMTSNFESVLFSDLYHQNNLIRFLNECYSTAAKDKHTISGYLGVADWISSHIENTMPNPHQEKFTSGDEWSNLFDGYVGQITEIEDSDRDDVFKKAFSKPSFEIDDLLLMDGKNPFSMGLSSGKCRTVPEADDEEISDELNKAEEDEGDKKNKFSNNRGTEYEDDGNEDGQKRESDEDGIVFSGITIDRRHNDLDEHDDDVNIEDSDFKNENLVEGKTGKESFKDEKTEENEGASGKEELGKEKHLIEPQGESATESEELKTAKEDSEEKKQDQEKPASEDLMAQILDI